MKSLHALTLAISLPIALGLAGCQKHDNSTPADTQSAGPDSPATAAGPDAKPGITAEDGKLVLPPVAGRPAAAYFSISNSGSAAAHVVSVHVDQATSAQMHATKGGTMSKVDDLTLEPGAKVKFSPGNMHVMVFGLPASVKAGDTVEMTLTFAGGDKLSMPLKVQAMGNMNDMADMHH